MTSRWFQIYQSQIKKQGEIAFFNTKIREKFPLLASIQKYAGSDKLLLEAGCGTSVVSIYLAKCGFKTVALDINDEMLGLAKKIASKFRLQYPIHYVQGDLFNLPFHDKSFRIAHSHGVLEHFSDEIIIHLIQEQLRVAEIVIISVPSHFFRPKDALLGDERFLPPDHWKWLISQSQADILEWFAFDYNQGIARIISTIKRFLYSGGVPPYLTFVVKRR